MVAGADTPAGQQLLAEARARGALTLGIIADGPASAHKVEVLKRTAADIAVTESYCDTWYVQPLPVQLVSPSKASCCCFSVAETGVACG